jgi:hypothetical protein
LPVSIRLFYPKEKPGFTDRALVEMGARTATWPKGLPLERTNHMIVFPMYGTSALIELDPTGWHCVSQTPKIKIRKFRGKGNEEELLDKMTVGEYGLMNVDGPQRLPEADVVNIVEGISDLGAVQAVLGPWRDGATEADLRRHVVLSSGGATYHPKIEWMQHFTGKEIRIWPHVGDAKNEGEISGAVWTAAMVKVAKTVRVPKLPLGKDGGKNDVRAWLTEPVGEPGPDGKPIWRTYADLDAYARTFEPVEATDAAAGMSAGDALLKSLGLVVIGEHEGTQRIEVYAETTRKIGTIGDLNRLNHPNLVQFLGRELVDEYVHDGKDPQPGKAMMKDVRTAIADAASDRAFRTANRIGGGAWLVDTDIVLVKAKEAGVIRRTKIERINSPFYKTKLIDLSFDSEEWCDFAEIERYLVEAQRDTWCFDVFQEGAQLFSKWYWKQQAAPRLIASMVIAAWLQTMWIWRPEIFITGDSETGKSLLVETVLPSLFGSLAWKSGKVTEAAIRQKLRHHSKIPIHDEFEHDKHRPAILELYRLGGRGGSASRGTPDHRGVNFFIQHIPWFAAIETGLKRQPDKNRFIMLEMLEIPEDLMGTEKVPTKSQLQTLGLKLLAVGIRHFERIRELAALLKMGKTKGVPGRVLECFSLPCAIAAAIEGLNVPEAKLMMSTWLGQWDFQGQSVKDKVEVLDEIMHSHVRLDHGVTRTVGQLLADHNPGPDTTIALEAVGIRKMIRRTDGERVLFIHPTSVQRHLLRNSDYAGHQLSDYLLRLKGARRSQHLLAGGNPKGIDIPLSTISAVFNIEESGEPPQSGSAGGF